MRSWNLSKHNVITKISDKADGHLKSKAEQKARSYYESCLDVNDTIEELGPKPMLDLIKKLGGWNVSMSSDFSITSWNIQNILQTIQNKYNIGALFSYAVGEDDRNSTRHVIQIDQSGLTLPTRENYLNKTARAKILPAYLDYMTKVNKLPCFYKHTFNIEIILGRHIIRWRCELHTSSNASCN